jgi:hypothetical protein
MAGLFAGNPADTILIRALIALVGGHVVGLVVGSIGERTIVEGIRTYEKNRPVPAARTESSGSSSLKLSA